MELQNDIVDVLSKKIYKFYKVNFTTNTYSVIKDVDSDKQVYDASSTLSDLFYSYLKFGRIFADDLTQFKEDFSFANLTNKLKTQGDYDIWFRRIIGSELVWFKIRIVKTSEFSEANQEAYIYLENCNVPQKLAFKNNPIAETVVSHISELYINMHVIDIQNNSYIAYKDNEFIRMFYKTGKANEDFALMMPHLFTNQYIKKVLEFVNIDTIETRMIDHNYISFDAIGNNFGWVRLIFLPLEYNYDNRLTKVLFVLQHIDKEKREIEKLTLISSRDTLTNLYNRYCYEEDKARIKYQRDIQVFSIDINGLKQVNDNCGHQDGDLLIKRAANCLFRTLHNYGSVYRTGGDEFIAILYTTVSSKEILVDLKNEIEKDNKNYNIVLSLSVGCAKYKDYKDLSFDELVKVSDKLMYEDKERYYTENNIEKYR